MRHDVCGMQTLTLTLTLTLCGMPHDVCGMRYVLCGLLRGMRYGDCCMVLHQLVRPCDRVRATARLSGWLGMATMQTKALLDFLYVGESIPSPNPRPIRVLKLSVGGCS